MSEKTVKLIKLADINEASHKLRSVDQSSEKYINTRESIRTIGLQNLLTVRELPDGKYELMDGHHRFLAMKELGVTEYNFQVDNSATDLDSLFIQIHGNSHINATKPVEYAKALASIMQLDPTMTVTMLAEKTSQNPSWVADILRLNKIQNAELAQAINDGIIPVTVGIAIAKLPEADQLIEFKSVMNMTAADALAYLKPKIAESKKAASTGTVVEKQFEVIPKLRPLVQLKAELEAGLPNIKRIVTASGVTDVESVLKLAIDWFLQVDSESVEKDRATFEAELAERKAKAEKREADRKAKLIEKAEAANKALAEASK